MPTLNRRTLPLLVILLLGLVAGSPLFAYPVSITINVTFVDIAGDSDPLGLGNSMDPVSGTITTTLDSATATGSSATYPASVVVSIPSLFTNPITESGSVTITTSGQITAAFSLDSNSFTSVLVIPGLTLPTPSPTAFGTKSFSSPASTTNYNFDGATGTVGVNGTITAVGLTASPLSGISATASANGTAPSPQTISVASNNPATPSISYMATVSPSTATWLTLTGATGTTPGTVTANFSTSLSPGTYTASVLVNDAGDSVGPITIPVTYNVTNGMGGGSSLLTSPGSVSFNFFLPTSVTGSQTVSVTSSGAAASYTASVSGASFVTVSPSSGTTPGTITISANGTGLSNGAYSATVMLSSSVGNVSIPVTVNVSGGSTGGGVSPITISPSSLTFTVAPGETTPAAQTVHLTSATPVSFNLENVALYLPITPLSGKTPATLTVPLNVADLTPGTHTDYIQVASGDTFAELTVTVNVGSVTLSSTPAALSFAYPATSASPSTQTITVTQSGSASAVPLVATSSVPWLTAIVSGDTVTVTANPDGLALGTLSGTLTISSPMGSNTLSIPVTLALTSTPPGYISVTPTALAFAYQVGGAVPPNQSLTVGGTPSASGVTLSAFGASWLSIPSSVANGTEVVGTLAVNPAGLAPGVYTGSVLVAGASFANTPTFVPVTLTVSSTATFGVSPGSLTFNYQPGGAAPGPQTIALSSTASNFINASANVTWLTITPASVATSATTPASFTVTAVPGSFTNGTYSALITFGGGGAAPQVVTVPVTLNVGVVATPVLDAVTNAMSYLTEAGSPGGFISLWGTGLGPTPAVPLQLLNSTTVGTSAGGTQVFANGIPCPILFSSAEQVNAILPFSVAGQTSAMITVEYQGVTSNALTLSIAPTSPGLFSLDGSGQGGGAILNSDLSVNTSTNPAPAGSIVVLFGGGAGQTNPAGSDGLIVPAVAPIPAPVSAVTATIAGQPATILYAGDAPDLVSGVLQVNVVIPAGTPSGPQPVVITTGGLSSQANLDVWVQ